MSESRGGTGVLDRVEDRVKEPPMYSVVLHNDDFTPMDFVVAILMRIFRHNENDAGAIMLAVHTRGKAVAGTYTREIAETKAAQSNQNAERNEFPLQATIEPAG